MKYLTASLLFALSATLGAAPADDRGNLENLSKLLAEARSSYIQRDYAQSNRVYAGILEALPEATRIDLMRGRIHYSMACNNAWLKNKHRALEHLEKAIEHGFWDGDYMAKDPTLVPLRGMKEFDAVVLKARLALRGMAFGMRSVTGEKLESKEYDGKVVVIDVWGTWCPPCRREIPHFIRLQDQYRDHGLRIIGMTWEKQEPNEVIKRRVQDFVARSNINYPCALMTREIKAAVPDLSSFPTTLFFDRRGRLRERFVGARDYETLELTVLKLLEEP